MRIAAACLSVGCLISAPASAEIGGYSGIELMQTSARCAGFWDALGDKLQVVGAKEEAELFQWAAHKANREIDRDAYETADKLPRALRTAAHHSASKLIVEMSSGLTIQTSQRARTEFSRVMDQCTELGTAAAASR